MSPKQFYSTKEQTQLWLESMFIKNFHIHENLIVDVNNHVDINEKELTYIPVRFGVVKGDFRCSRNHLKTLLGSPRVVEGDFQANGNELVNLIGSPKTIKGKFACTKNKLTSLEGAPDYVGSNMYLVANKLTSLDISTKIENSLYFYDNEIENILKIVGTVSNIKEYIFLDIEVSKNQPELNLYGKINDKSSTFIISAQDLQYLVDMHRLNTKLHQMENKSIVQHKRKI